MRILTILFLVVLLYSCGEQSPEQTSNNGHSDALIHSFAIPSEAVVTHLNWDAQIDFTGKRINATASYQIKASAYANRIALDVSGLTIKQVLVDSVETKEWWLGEPQPFLGQPLEIAISPESKSVSIVYSTSPDAGALQWLLPEQTAGKQQPFLFTQSQAILARTWIPCQDSPGIRFTYDATVRVPSGLMAVMSASNPTKVDSSGVYHFEMKQPIPSYLLALAVGDLVFQSVGNRTGVYAEPSVLAGAAYEFEDMQQMLESAENLYGTYAWERYDVLVLPPSFPFGGMENPRLTFATPTILAGDKSLTALVAHELAHSWSGNLVTNSTWNDFWLNEGFTVYFERRIMEEVYGKEYADMLAVLGRQDLEKSLKELADTPDDTRLKLELEGRNPDDGMSDIAYEKGYFLLRTIEENVGRQAMDAFLNKHFSSNAFSTITTETFLSNLRRDLFADDQKRYDALEIDTWVYQPGLPKNCVEVRSVIFDQVEAELEEWKAGSAVTDIDTAGWTTHQWLHFLRNQEPVLGTDRMQELDKAFGFTHSGNSEIAAEWFGLAIRSDYRQADAAIEDFLVKVGRRKFLVPLYKALVDKDPSLERARTIYAKARSGYHSVSTNTLDDLLQAS